MAGFKIQSTGLGDIDTRWNSLAEFSPLFQFLRSTDNAGLCRARSSVLPFLRCACVTYVTGGPATRSTANGQRHESLGFHCFSIDHHRDSVSCSFCRPHPAKPPHSGPILIIGDAIDADGTSRFDTVRLFLRYLLVHLSRLL